MSTSTNPDFAVRNDRRGDTDLVKGDLTVRGKLDLGGAVSAQGSLLSRGALSGGVELLTDDSGVVPPLNTDLLTSAVVTTAASTATLPDGKAGQLKIVVLATDGGDLVLTPDNLANGTTITFANAGESVLLVWAAGNWHVVGESSLVA